jgi:hypothetical protein
MSRIGIPHVYAAYFELIHDTMWKGKKFKIQHVKHEAARIDRYDTMLLQKSRFCDPFHSREKADMSHFVN